MMSNRLSIGESLPVNPTWDFIKALWSPQNVNFLILQGDGNLVLYRKDPQQAIWAAGTTGKGAEQLVMQADGNLVLYKAGGIPVWASGSTGTGADHLVAQDDGNLVLYKPGGDVEGNAVWVNGKPSASIAITGHADAASSGAVTLHGSVNPRGWTTRYGFQYGFDATYGQTVDAGINSRDQLFDFSATVGGLAAGRTYHYRALARRDTEIVAGGDMQFTVPGAQRADLSFVNTWIEPNEFPSQGEVFVVYFSFANVGTATSASCTIRLVLDGTQSFDIAAPEYSAGAQDKVHLLVPGTVAAGDHRVDAYLDIYNQVPESNETNNYSTNGFIVEPTGSVKTDGAHQAALGSPNLNFARG